MDGDFSWLWRREELSDFTLCIRPCIPKQATEEEQPVLPTTAASNDGIRTRSGKRRRAASSTAASAAGAAAAATAGGAEQAGPSHQAAGDRPGDGQIRRMTRRRAATQAAAAAAAGNAVQEASQQGQQVDQEQQQQDQLQPAHTRHTRRQHQQQRQQGGEQQLDQQQQQQLLNQGARSGQQQQQQPPDELQQLQQHQGQDAQAAAAAAAAAAASGRRPRRHGQHRAQSTEPSEHQQDVAPQQQDQQQQLQHGPAADAPQGRVTRSSSRQKQRGSNAAAVGTAGAGNSRAAAITGQQEAAGPNSRGGSRCNQQQQQQQCAAGTSGEAAAAAAAGSGAGSNGAAAVAAAAGPSGQQQVPEIRLPVHAVVLAGFSEYFKALICSWSGNLNRTLTLDVGVDEGHAAEMMIEFMYTGKLPSDTAPDELLRMIRLADQYQVTRFLAAASSSFEALPLSSLSLGLVLELFSLPQVMLDAPEMGRVVAKARAKLLELYGDLEKVWSSEALREQFLALPLPAVRCLLASELTAVAAENTALVALAGWVEEGPAGRAATPAQRKELLSLVRLPYLTSSFIGDILHSVPWMRDALDSRQLLNAFQFAAASESTRQRLASYEYGPSALTPHFRCPRPLSSVTRASFEWAIELSTIKRMVADAKLWGRVVELSSPLHYFAGFWWQLLFNVEKTPTPPDAAPDVAAAAAATVVEFVGVRCHVNCGAHDYWPRVVRFKASIAALQTGFWEMDYAYLKAIEGPIVDGVGLGYPGFFALPGQALENEAAWSRFVRQGRVQLRCEVLDCE